MEQATKKRRLKWHEVTHEQDIKYRGPLTYQHFQIIGWLCIVLAQAAVLIKVGSKMQTMADRLAGVYDVVHIIGAMALPFLLIANFAQIMNGHNSYKKLLLKNFGAMAAIFVVYVIFLNKYVCGTLELISDGSTSPMDAVGQVIQALMGSGVFCFNIFVDLFLCTLVMFFLNHRPTKIFTGKKVIIFRLFTLLPVAYEIGCMVLKVKSAWGEITVSPTLYPLIAVKPPMTFLLFLILAFYIKSRERRFCRKGKTHEQYQEFLKTKKNSWNFSVFLAIMILVVSVIDYIALGLFMINDTGRTTDEDLDMLAQKIVEEREMKAYEAMSDEDREAYIASLLGVETAAPADATATAAPTGATETATEKAAENGTTAATAAPTAATGTAAEKETTEERKITEEYLTEEEAKAAAKTIQERYNLTDEETEEMLTTLLEKSESVGSAIGFGKSMYLIFIAPLVLLFSYTKEPKYKIISMVIPVGGVLMIILVYVQGVFQLLHGVTLKKINLGELTEVIRQVKHVMKFY